MVYFVTFRSLRVGDQKFEVHFKGQHVMHYPWMPYTTGTKCKKEVEVKMLRHVTHFSEADSIIHNSHGEDYQIQFKAFRKRGKDGSTLSTYQSESPSIKPDDATMYKFLTYNSLFPGCYSWWSPVDEIHTSLFGTIEFAAKVDDLIECYKKSFDPPLKEVQFRCGGTLRYKIQACKVIIICPKIFQSHLPIEDYPEMPMMTEAEIKIQYDNPEGYRTVYDSFAFVFFFPREHMQMNCPEQAIICKKVRHNYTRCATKGRSCPDGFKEPPEQLKLKLENMKKRREQKSVSSKSAHITLSPLEDESTEEEMEDKGMKYHPSMPKKRKRNDDDNEDNELGPTIKKGLIGNVVDL